MDWQSFINNLTNQELCYLIYREGGYTYKEIGHFMDVSKSRIGYISKRIRKKAIKFINIENGYSSQEDIKRKKYTYKHIINQYKGDVNGNYKK